MRLLLHGVKCGDGWDPGREGWQEGGGGCGNYQGQTAFNRMSKTGFIHAERLEEEENYQRDDDRQRMQGSGRGRQGEARRGGPALGKEGQGEEAARGNKRMRAQGLAKAAADRVCRTGSEGLMQMTTSRGRVCGGAGSREA